MKRYLLLTLLCVALAVQAVAQSPDSLAGNWQGALEFSGKKHRLVLKVEKAGEGYVAKFDSPDQGAYDLPIATITLVGKKMSFTAPQFGMSYDGTVNDKNDEITGTFKQGAGSTPFVFKRVGEVPGLSRPQEPKKPYPYNEEEVSYRNTLDNVKLTATLTIPRNGSHKHPAVLLISGSGSQDRDSLTFGHRPFLVLADHLTRNGIAVLRVDDRGTGGSDLGSLSVTSENFMQDVLTGVNFLKTRKEIDPKKIGLIGHSEGGMIAPMAAARSRDIAFIVLLAGLGQTGGDLLATQTELMEKARGTDPAAIDQAKNLLNKIYAIAKAEHDQKRIEQLVNEEITRQVAAMDETGRKAFGPIESHFRALMPMFGLPWFRYFITFDPAPVLKKVKVPVLALNGELDLQVASKVNLDLIAAALKAGKNKDVTVKAFPSLNHLFQTSKTGVMSEYVQIEETMSPDVLNTISDWISKRTR